MSGIDLYASLGLDRSADPATLAAELDRRISSSWGEDPAKVTQLRNARAILGDAGRRVRYDRQLDDPAAPPVTEQVLEQLASSLGNESETSVIPAADLGPQGYGQQQGFNTNPYASQPWQQGQPGKSGTSKVVWVVGAAVAAVIIVLGAVGTTWFIMRDDGDDNSSTSASRFTEQDAPHSEAVPVPRTRRPSPSRRRPRTTTTTSTMTTTISTTTTSTTTWGTYRSAGRPPRPRPATAGTASASRSNSTATAR
ncbi:MAG: hypothetical protein L0L92_06755 [Corynebacterium variabile]|nr:hypothetical protein [Corynebacterium variabile]